MMKGELFGMPGLDDKTISTFSDSLGKSVLSALEKLNLELKKISSDHCNGGLDFDTELAMQESLGKNYRSLEPESCQSRERFTLKASPKQLKLHSDESIFFREEETDEAASILNGISFDVVEEVEIPSEIEGNSEKESDDGLDFSIDESSTSDFGNQDSFDNICQHPQKCDYLEDEWENDDDVGYILVPVTEQEFLGMFESFHMSFTAPPKDESNGDDIATDPWNEAAANLDSLQIADDMPECTRAVVVESIEAVDCGVEGDLSTAQQLLQDISNPLVQVYSSPKRLVSEAVGNEQNSDVMKTSEVQLESNGIIAGIHSTAHDFEEAKGQFESIHLAKILAEGEFACHSSNSMADKNAANAVNTLNPPHKKPTSHGERRKSEIMGQHRFIGADQQLHSFYNLKVIFEPNRTGFEEVKHFNPPKGTIVAGRYEVSEFLGQAAFSSALQCLDLAAEDHEPQWVCLKVIKNSKDFFDQSLDEIKLLQYINSRGDPDKHHVLEMIDFFYFKEHLFIVSELLRENLYDFGKYVRDNGLEPFYTIVRLKKIMKQVLEALKFIHSLDLIHCDIKPENIVMKSYSRCEVKLIDFGSSCFTTDNLTTYIQSRSYRAPEVILGHSYDCRIDIWSMGAVLAELHTGYVLFQNESVGTMLARIIAILGPLPKNVLQAGKDSLKYFVGSSVLYERSEDDGAYCLAYPKRTSLAARLHIDIKTSTPDEKDFLDFVHQLLDLDPATRPSAADALRHRWLAGTDDLHIPPPVLTHSATLASSLEHDLDEQDVDEPDN